MRLRRLVAAATASLLVVGLGQVSSSADEVVPPAPAAHVPSQADVSRAADAAADAATAVAGVRARLAVAGAAVEQAQIDAAAAAERWNGARVALAEASNTARSARGAAATAAEGVADQQRAYSDALVRSYQSAPSLAGVSAMVSSDGVAEFVQQRATVDNAVDALDGRYARFRAAATVSELSAGQANRAEDEAAALAAEARTLRADADAAAARALAEAEELTEQRDDLIAELAELEGISVDTARQRQEALERAAAERAAETRRVELASRQAAEQAAAKVATEAAEAKKSQRARQKAREQAWETDRRAAEEQRAATRPTTRPEGEPAAEPSPEPSTEPSAPSPAAGAAAAIAFAESQLGKPYLYGGSGPNAWDCSGLTSKAWARGGKTLPHWSVGQYRVTTPITFDDLAPGDLVFWGNSKNPDSIFHVALYVGNGQIIHAPRSGRPVVKESVLYWRTPDFFGRP